jgi:hypothetical protein
MAPEPWFQAVSAAAEELAPSHPVFLCGEIVVDGEGATQVDRAFHEAWRLVGAGLTHLAVDASAAAPAERGRVVSEVVQAATQQGIGVEVVLSVADGAQAARRGAALLDDLSRRGVSPDLASVRCPSPAGEAEARLQLAALARISHALGGLPVMRRGPLTPELLRLLPGSPVKACEDGGAAAARALRSLASAREAPGGGAGREAAIERAAADLSREGADRLEATAYVDAIEILEAMRLRGSARAVARALEQRLEER